VRELRNALESVVVFHRGSEVRVRDLPPEIQACAEVTEAAPEPAEIRALPATELDEPERLPDEASAARWTGPSVPSAASGGGSGAQTMADIEREAILHALERTGGRRLEAARLLDIGLRTLQRKLKDYKEQGFYQE